MYEQTVKILIAFDKQHSTIAMLLTSWSFSRAKPYGKKHKLPRSGWPAAAPVRAKHSTFIYTCILRIMTNNARNFYREVMKTQTSKIARLLNRDIDVDEHLLNISSNELTFFEKLVLCRGLKFSLPQVVQPIEVKGSFEKLYCNIEPFIADDLKELTAASLKSIALNYIQRKDSKPPKLLKKAIKI